jgi:ABC-type Co2+ transport system permease subunit
MFTRKEITLVLATAVITAGVVSFAQSAKPLDGFFRL